MGIPPFVEKIRWAQFRNASGHTVPPWGVMAVTSTEQSGDGQERIYVIERPGATFRAEYLINSQFAVANGDYGDCTKDIDVLGAYDTALTPAYGDGLGPKPDSFLLFKGYPCLFRVEGIADTTNKLAYGTFTPLVTTLLGKTDSSISAISTDTPGSGTVSIYYFNGTSFADTTMNVTAYNMSSQAVTSGAYVQMKFIDGIWVVDFESCSA